MHVYSLEQLVATARAGSPFYRALYRDLPASGIRHEQLPIATYDKISELVHGDYRALVAADDAYGMYYASSATTGRPKMTLFGRDEWRTVNQMLAATHWKTGTLRDGDVIANLCEAGSASFMAIHRVVDAFPGRCSEIPIGCDFPYAHLARTYRTFRANVVATLNSTLLGLAEHVLRTGEPDTSIERLLGGGELLYGKQEEVIRKAFPRAQMCPFVYAATDAGMIGYAQLGDDMNTYRAFDTLCRFEIVDPVTHQVILEPNRVGMAVVTSYFRITTPAIRYAYGDMARWLDDPRGPSPRFALEGRLFPFAQEVAGVTFSEDDVWRVVRALERTLSFTKFQLVLTGPRARPSLELVLSLHDEVKPHAVAKQAVVDALREIAPLRTALERGDVAQVEVRFVDLAHFEAMSRRKGRMIVDERSGD